MKYSDGKLKIEHHFLKEFKDFFDFLKTIDEIKRIIPGRISRQQKGTSDKHISISYFTKSGMKLKIKKGGTSQEVFITCDPKDKDKIKEIILNINKIN